jgi:hypothetical protein
MDNRTLAQLVVTVSILIGFILLISSQHEVRHSITDFSAIHR